MKAFLPISASTQLFSSARMRSGLTQLPKDYDELIVVVADRIQFYNDVAAKNADLESVIARWSAPSTPIFAERVRWFARIATEISLRAELKVLSIDDLTSPGLLQILRSVLAFYEMQPRFRGQVDAAVREFSEARLEGPRGRLSKMSKFYVLEEIALNIHVRTTFGIYDEFYLGPQMTLLPALYQSDFRSLVTESPSGATYDTGRVRFFFWGTDEWQEWHADRARDTQKPSVTPSDRQAVT